MAEKRITVACPSCNTITELEKGFFSWKKARCAKCNKKITFDKVGVQVVTCDHCKNDVIFNAERKNDCPICHQPLNAFSDRQAVGCPVCSMPVYYRPGETEATCLNCGGSFNPLAEAGKQAGIVSNNAPDVRMPGTLPEEELFWKHPLERMPVNTRVIAKGGMYAVGMNGATSCFVVDGQSAYLSETPLMNDTATYDGAANPMVDVEIYYVRQAFTGKFRWGGASDLTDRYRQVTKFCYNGTVEIDRVTDPAAFLRFINFDADATVNDFRMQRPTGGAEEPGRFAATLRDCIRSVCQKALENVRDRYNTVGEELLDHKADVTAEIERQANLALADWGISVRSLTAEISKAGASTIRQDVLEERLAGSMTWKTPAPVIVHLKDKPHAYANLLISGSLYVTVDDEDKLARCKEAPLWRAESTERSKPRNDISLHVGNTLMGRFQADIQQLISDMAPPLYMLQSYTAYLSSQALRLLNSEGGYFAQRGMSVSDLSIAIAVGEKSPAYVRQEQAVSFEDELSIREQMETLSRQYEARKDDALTEDHIHRTGNQTRRDQADTEKAIHDIDNSSRVQGAQAAADHAAGMQQLRNQAEMEALKRSIDFDAWNENQRLAEAQESAAYARHRREQLHQQESHALRVNHERDIQAIAQQIEQSKLDWREKLDAYARLQRGMAFQDEMAQKDANADFKARETSMLQKLRAEDRQAMEALDHEQALRSEEIARMRFAREMEKRREELAAQAVELQARFDRERALAEEKERRAQAQEEIDTLRLMLEYLAKAGAQQVSAEHLRKAREEARLTWQRKHEAETRRAAEERRQEQKAAEKEMTDRAQHMTEQLLQMQSQLEGKRIDAETAKAIGSTRNLIDQLNSLSQAAMSMPVTQMVAPMNQWFENLMNLMKNSAASPQQPAAPAGNTGMCECGVCHNFYDPRKENYECPFCKLNAKYKL